MHSNSLSNIYNINTSNYNYIHVDTHNIIIISAVHRIYMCLGYCLPSLLASCPQESTRIYYCKLTFYNNTESSYHSIILHIKYSYSSNDIL